MKEENNNKKLNKKNLDKVDNNNFKDMINHYYTNIDKNLNLLKDEIQTNLNKIFIENDDLFFFRNEFQEIKNEINETKNLINFQINFLNNMIYILTQNNNYKLNKCESYICKNFNYYNRPTGTYNKIENKYLCHLCNY